MFQSFFKKTPQKNQRLPHTTTSLQKTMYLPQGELTYELQYKQRKTMGIYIYAPHVVVRVPYGADQNRVERFLHEKSVWIEKKLQEQKQKQAHRQQQSVFWGDGGRLTYLGEELVLKLDSESSEIILRSGGVLEIGTAQRARSKKTVGTDQLVKIWMQEQALILFKQKCSEFSSLLGVHPKQIALTSAKTRWGSANAKGCIRLHWRLMQMPPDVIDYVVVHELAHLKEMNHSPRFWALVRNILPDYAQRRVHLKRNHLSLW